MRSLAIVRSAVGVALCVSGLALSSGTPATALAPRVEVAGAATLPARAVLTAPAPTTTVDVVLASRNAAAERAFLTQLTTVGSPQYHHFLSPASFAARFGASPATAQAVAQYFQSHGLRERGLSRGRLVLRVQGRTALFAHVLRAHIAAVRHGDQRTNVLLSPATLPASIARDVVGLSGLSRVAMTTNLVRSHTTAPAYASACPSAGASSGHTPNNLYGYTVPQEGALYGLLPQWVNGHTGTGAVIAMYELGTYDPADTKVFFNCYHLKPTINVIPVDKGTTGAFSDEATMDIEQAAALAPGATIDVYGGPNNASGPLDVLTAIADQNVATVVSTSWGDCEGDPTGTVAAEEPLFEQMAAEGMTVVASSGDEGSSDCNGITNNRPAVDDPASQPWVTGVGGLTVSSTAPVTESVWNAGSGGASGGGASTVWSRPTWQKGTLFAGNTSQGVTNATTRMVPDLSVLGDPNTGFIQYYTGTNKGSVVCGKGSCSGWGSIGGTSVGSPIVSALVAIASQVCSPSSGPPQRLGFLNPTLYQIARSGTDFIDVTSGTNDIFNQNVYGAGTGYDMASGLGSPSTSFVSDLCPSTFNAAKSSFTTPRTANYVGRQIPVLATIRDAAGSALVNTPVTFTAQATSGTVTFDGVTSSPLGSTASVTVRTTTTGVASVTVSTTSPGTVTLTESVAGETIGNLAVTFVPLPLSLTVPVVPKVLLTAVTASSITLRIVSPSHPAPPVALYQLLLDGVVHNFAGSTRQLVVHHLTPSTAYRLQIEARNANGVSPLSAPLHVTTPA